MYSVSNLKFKHNRSTAPLCKRAIGPRSCKMQTATFYRRSERSRAASSTRAAQADVREAAEALRVVLRLETGAPERQRTAVLERATERLTVLQGRVARKRELMLRVERLEEGGKGEGQTRLAEVEQAIVGFNVERVGYLAAKDEILRDVLVARRKLKVSLTKMLHV